MNKIFSMFISIICFACTFNLKANMTNGIFTISNNLGYVLMSNSNNVISTNMLLSRKTYQFSNNIVRFYCKTNTIFYFPGNIVLNITADSIFSIHSCYQDMDITNKNLSEIILKACDFKMKFIQGEFIILYNAPPKDSVFNVNTPFDNYSLTGGKYLIRINDKSSLIYVMNGLSKDNLSNEIHTNQIEISVMFSDIFNKSKVIRRINTINRKESSYFCNSIRNLVKYEDNVKFIIIDKKILGIWIQ